MEVLLQIAKYAFLALLLGFVYVLYRAILSEARSAPTPSPEAREAPAAVAPRPAPARPPALLAAPRRPPPVPLATEDAAVAPPSPLEPVTLEPARAPTVAPGARLVVSKSPDPEKLAPGTVLMLEPATYLGRATDSSIPLPDRFASLRHAALLLRDGGYVLRDMGSTNGTFLNGVRLSAEAPLTEGDQIEIGTTVLTYRR